MGDQDHSGWGFDSAANHSDHLLRSGDLESSVVCPSGRVGPGEALHSLWVWSEQEGVQCPSHRCGSDKKDAAWFILSLGFENTGLCVVIKACTLLSDFKSNTQRC